ncbi:BQ5605_C029g10616 [Microbotryum silenes-dioicae]|uniref:BQ5605_C029g10616 protein n=1 Tax=Microbotryum silenes-dioicae TaxID=796604 RepID=A0A2X0MJ21_9BASI|nr:BQ5605_C029g10616 [Microbotryum silenes-dioicae]
MHGDRPRLELLTENELSIRFFYESKACLHALAPSYTRELYPSGRTAIDNLIPRTMVKCRQGELPLKAFCQCSRCDSQGAKYIIKHLRHTTEESYHEFSSYDGAIIEADKMSQPTQNSQVENAEDDLQDLADEHATQSVNRQTRGHNPWRMNSQQRDEFVEKLLLKYKQYTRGLNYGRLRTVFGDCIEPGVDVIGCEDFGSQVMASDEGALGSLHLFNDD